MFGIKWDIYPGKIAVPLPRNQLIKLVAGLFCIRKTGTTSGVWNLANGRSLNLFNKYQI